jgi:hypothetical protein
VLTCGAKPLAVLGYPDHVTLDSRQGLVREDQLAPAHLWARDEAELAIALPLSRAQGQHLAPEHAVSWKVNRPGPGTRPARRQRGGPFSTVPRADACGVAPRDSDHLRTAARAGRPDLQGDLDVDQLVGGSSSSSTGKYAQQSRQALREQAHLGGGYNRFSTVGFLNAHLRQGSGRPMTDDWHFPRRAGQ